MATSIKDSFDFCFDLLGMTTEERLKHLYDLATYGLTRIKCTRWVDGRYSITLNYEERYGDKMVLRINVDGHLDADATSMANVAKKLGEFAANGEMIEEYGMCKEGLDEFMANFAAGLHVSNEDDPDSIKALLLETWDTKWCRPSGSVEFIAVEDEGYDGSDGEHTNAYYVTAKVHTEIGDFLVGTMVGEHEADMGLITTWLADESDFSSVPEDKRFVVRYLIEKAADELYTAATDFARAS